MCEHCGCRGVEPIGQLMDEHYDLLELGERIRRSLAGPDLAATLGLLDDLRDGLVPHAIREERGLFAALRAKGEYVEAVDALEVEHASFEAVLDRLGSLDPAGPDFGREVRRMLDELADHIDQENLGIFPVAVVTLGADGWEMVAAAHAEGPDGAHDHDHEQADGHKHECGHSHELAR